MKGGRILLLPISGRLGASSRYRVYQFIPSLEAAGYRVSVIEPPGTRGRGLSRLVGGFMEEGRIMAAARQADIVFIQKRLFRPGFIKRLKAAVPRMVFDYDDSIFTSPRGDWGASTRTRVHGRLRAVMGASDVVIAGNNYLADKAAPFGAVRVEVIPTALDPAAYRLKRHKDGPVTLGWIGSSVNHRYLDMIRGALAEAMASLPGSRLLVVSDKDYEAGGITVENRRWSEDAEAGDILEMDIGLMPLADDDWTRGKCALKALQYMAAGIPPVCSPVGANVEVVEDGVDGFLPGGAVAWVGCITRLAASPALRAAIGEAARRKVEARFSIGGQAARYAAVLGSL